MILVVFFLRYPRKRGKMKQQKETTWHYIAKIERGVVWIASCRIMSRTVPKSTLIIYNEKGSLSCFSKLPGLESSGLRFFISQWSYSCSQFLLAEFIATHHLMFLLVTSSSVLSLGWQGECKWLARRYVLSADAQSEVVLLRYCMTAQKGKRKSWRTL